MASIRDVEILDISAGWNRTGPNPNQDLDPFTSIPRKITATSRPSARMYIGSESPSYIRGLRAKSIMPASMIDVPIHTACFPLLQFQSKIEDGSVECMDAYMFTHPIRMSMR